jgi:ABC-type antimicrobial peptide transport system permease subunit
VATGDDHGPVEFLDAAGARIKLVSMGGAIGGTSLLVAILVVVGTFALSIQQRHRELALLRAIAATPKKLRRLLGREALLVGAAAGIAGALAGLPLASWLHGRFVEMGAVPATLERTTGVFPLFTAVLVTVIGAWAAARISGRRITRIRPAEAMAEASTVLLATDRDQAELTSVVKQFPWVAVLEPARVDRLQAERRQANAEVNHLAMGLVLAFTAIAVVNMLAMSVSERIREFAMLRLAGATRRQVLRMLRIEALSILVMAAALGTGIALAVLTAFSIGMTGSAAPAVRPLVYAAVVGTAAFLALVATALPGRVALRVRPVEVATSRQ